MMCHVPYHQQQLLLAYYLDLSDDALRTSFYAQSYKNLVNRQGYEPAVSQSVRLELLDSFSPSRQIRPEHKKHQKLHTTNTISIIIQPLQSYQLMDRLRNQF